jgi:hypothetical protein
MQCYNITFTGPGAAGRPFATGQAWASKAAQQAEPFAVMASRTAPMASMQNHRLSEAVMKKFNNTLEGTDCGDAGLPAHRRDIAKAKTVLRVVPKTLDIESMATRTTAPNACDWGEI